MEFGFEYRAEKGAGEEEKKAAGNDDEDGDEDAGAKRDPSRITVGDIVVYAFLQQRRPQPRFGYVSALEGNVVKIIPLAQNSDGKSWGRAGRLAAIVQQECLRVPIDISNMTVYI